MLLGGHSLEPWVETETDAAPFPDTAVQTLSACVTGPAVIVSVIEPASCLRMVTSVIT